jgi:hypothetical protein
MQGEHHTPVFHTLNESVHQFMHMFHDTNTLLLFALHHRADIINRGFGGYNTRMGVYLVDEILASFGAGRVRLVTIGFGANDANLPDGSNAVSGDWDGGQGAGEGGVVLQAGGGSVGG